MTHHFDRGASERRVYPFPEGRVPGTSRLPEPAACAITIAGQAAMDSYRFNLGQGATAAEVMAALDLTVRSVEAGAGAALEITVREWNLLGLPVLTIGLGTPPLPPPPPPRCG